MKARLHAMHVFVALASLRLYPSLARDATFPDQSYLTVKFHIDSGDARATLVEFTRQTGMQVFYDFNVISGIKTHEVNGEMDAVTALKTMTQGTALSFELINARTVAVIAKASPTPTRQNHLKGEESRRNRSASPKADTDAEHLAQVLVSGSTYSGARITGVERIELGRDELDTSDQHNVADSLHSLPQVFGGGPTQDTSIGEEARVNTALKSGINFVGLGARATLVLVDGRRFGTGSEFVDVLDLPLSAIERIDILPYGSTARYGAEAVGGTINFITRSDFSGAESVVSSGTGTQGALQTSRFAQTLGDSWGSGRALVSVDFYGSNGLPAYDRSYAVSDLRPFGGSDFDTSESNPGNVIVRGSTFAIPAGQDGAHLSANSLVPGTLNLQHRYDLADLLPQLRRWSLIGTGRQLLSDTVSLFGEMLATNRVARKRTGGLGAALVVPSSNPFYVNPLGETGPITVDYNFGPDLGPETDNVTVKTADVTLGLDIECGRSWNMTVYGGYAHEKQDQRTDGLVNFAALYAALAAPNPSTAFNPFGDGSHTSPATLSYIRSSEHIVVDSELRSINLGASGPILKLPGGQLTLTLGAEFRDQVYASVSASTETAPWVRGRLGREIVSAFGSVMVPLFGDGDSSTDPRRLDISAAARYDHYGGFPQALTPSFGIKWSPIASVSARSTWSKSIRVPSLEELDDSRNLLVPFTLPDATSPTGFANALVWSGKNASLSAERATSWTAGVDLTLEQIKGLSVGLTYFNITFPSRIEEAVLTPYILNNPQYTGTVIHNPDAAVINYACAHSNFQKTGIDCPQPPVSALVDLRPHNAETLRTNGVDFGALYERRESYGRFALRLNGTYLLSFSQQDGKTAPIYDLLSTQNNPINVRLRGSLSYNFGHFDVIGAVNFVNSYRDTASYPVRRVAASTTYDMMLGFDITMRGGGWCDNTRVGLSVLNIFNVSPPFLNNGVAQIGYDQENADPFGRLMSVQVRKRW